MNGESTPAGAAPPSLAAPDADDVQRVVEVALAEDLRHGHDVTTIATVPADRRAVADVIPRTPGVLAGIPYALAAFGAVTGTDVDVLERRDDGDRVSPHVPVLVVRGPVRALLTAERTALNLLCHASGIATLTARWVDAVRGTGCLVRDTRKTLPGLRRLQKYAVRCGGGANHRLGLGDAVLIKDNHIAAAGSVTAALHAARQGAGEMACEVEVDNCAQLDEALAARADEVLLDNFGPDECVEAVRRRDRAGVPTALEASGGLRIENARTFADTGVDFLAVGELTHSAPTVDIGMDMR